MRKVSVAFEVILRWVMSYPLMSYLFLRRVAVFVDSLIFISPKMNRRVVNGGAFTGQVILLVTIH